MIGHLDALTLIQQKNAGFWCQNSCGQEALSRASEALGLDRLRIFKGHRGSPQHIIGLAAACLRWTVVCTPHHGSNLEHPCPGRRSTILSSQPTFLIDQTEKLLTRPKIAQVVSDSLALYICTKFSPSGSE